MTEPATHPKQLGAKKTALDVVVQAILDRQLVPLLGAGISTDAKVDSRSDLDDGFQNVGNLVKIIHHRLIKKINDQPNRHGITPNRHEINQLACNNRLGELCEKYIDAHSYHHSCPDEHAESYRELCEALKISEFSLLEPTRAHRFIAFLACEDLIPEVITTNYDCCLERAFYSAHGLDYPQTSDDVPCNDEFQLHVSHDLETYRKSACTPHLPAFGGTKPVLRVHKINGCAQHFKNDKTGNNAIKILLTERQLQDWRERLWAADMIRDRLRTRKILTSGFGSAEPQVRHTVGLVVEEEKSTSAAIHDNMSVLKRPNLVIVTGYEGNPKQPTFFQHQILIAQWQALFRRKANSRSEIAREMPARHPAYDAFIGPNATAVFKFAEQKTVLPADDLWLEIYGRVASQLLYNRLHPARSFNQSLNALVRCGTGLVARLSTTLFPNVPAAPYAQSITQRTVPIIGAPHLFRMSDGESQKPLISTLIYALFHHGKARKSPIRYFPIRSHSDIFLWYALVRQALGCEIVPEGVDEHKPTFVKLCTLAENRDYYVLLRARSLEAVSHPTENGGPTPHVILEIGGTGVVDTHRYAAESVSFNRERPPATSLETDADNSLSQSRGRPVRGKLSSAPPVVDLIYALKTEPQEVSTIASFDRLIRHIVMFPTMYRRRTETGLKSLNRRS